MKNLRVLILTGWYPNGQNAIKGVFVREQVMALHKSGLEVVVFYPFDEEIPPGELKLAWEEGVKVYRANSMALRNRYLARLSSYVLALRSLRRITDEFKPDLLHVHVGYPASIIAYFFTRRRKLPYLITEHMSYLRDYVDKIQHRILLKPAFEHAAWVLPVSPFLAQTIKDFGWKTALEPVPNVVDTGRFSREQSISDPPGSGMPAGFEDEAERESKHVLFVGGLDEAEIKGLQFLLPAFAAFRRETDACLHIVGDGPLRKTYEEKARELGIGGDCFFHGWVDPRDMPDYYRNSDFLVMASLKETFGCVLIEAMACGKPVLATACGGPQSIVKEGTGLLVAPGQVSALEQGLREMTSRLSQFDPAFLRQYAERTFGPEAIAGRLIELYRRSII